MPINITVVGSTGAHTFRRTNVNLADNYIYYKGTPGVVADNIPVRVTNGTGFIYSTGVGSITGLTDDSLVFAKRSGTSFLSFATTQNGTDIDFTGLAAGDITFNTPTVFSNRLNIDGSTPSNQAVKYFTSGTPVTNLVSGNTYFLKNVDISAFAGTQALYTLADNTHTFTTCGQTGRVGPTQAQMRAAYNTTWDETFLTQGTFQGYQDWVVPVSGTYTFTASGAAGFDGSGAGGVGRGAVVRGTVTLTKGEIITIAVGQRGAAPASGGIWGGSGGGTFVVRKSGNEPLFVAGGGSAESGSGAGRDGVTTTLGGTSTAGIASGGAPSFGGLSQGGRSAAGGGFNGVGQTSATGDLGGGSFFTQGLTHATNTRTGGFGGFTVCTTGTSLYCCIVAQGYSHTLTNTFCVAAAYATLDLPAAFAVLPAPTV
jgi:hypothetical protein